MERADARKMLGLRDNFGAYELEAAIGQVQQSIRSRIFINEGFGEMSGKNIASTIQELEALSPSLPSPMLRQMVDELLIHGRTLIDSKGDVTKLIAGVVCGLALVAQYEQKFNEKKAEINELKKQIKELKTKDDGFVVIEDRDSIDPKEGDAPKEDEYFENL